MTDNKSVRTKALGRVTAALTVLASLAACLGQSKAPELITGDAAQVTIVADLDGDPKPLAKSHCTRYGKRPLLNDTAPASGNLLRGWATGTKVFIYTFDCR